MTVAVPKTETGTRFTRPHSHTTSRSRRTLSPWENREHSDIWQGRSRYELVDRMRTDSAISAVRQILVVPTTTARFALNTNGVRPEVADFIATQLNFDRSQPRTGQHRFKWADYVHNALLAVDYGNMLFNQIAAYNKTTGLYELHRLSPRMPHSITERHLTDQGGLISVTQTGNIQIPINALVVHLWPRLEAAEWEGTSLFRTAYKHWLLRDQMYEIDAIAAERNGMGIPVAEIMPGTDSPEIDDMLENVRAGANAFLKLPASTGTAGSTFRLVGVEGKTHDIMGSAVEHRREIARAMLAHVVTLGEDNGARSLGDTFAELLCTAQNRVAANFTETVTDHVIADLVAWNWGVDEPYPVLEHRQIVPKQAATAENIAALVSAGVIRPDAALDEWARDLLSAPPADETTARDVGPWSPTPAVTPTTTARKGRTTQAKGPTVPQLAARAAALVQQLELLE